MNCPSTVLLRQTIFPVLVAATFAVVFAGLAEADCTFCDASSISLASGVTVTCLPEFPELPTTVRIEFDVRYSKSCTSDCQDELPAVQVRVKLLDYTGDPNNPLHQATRSFTPGCSAATESLSFDFGCSCEAFPLTYRIELYDGRACRGHTPPCVYAANDPGIVSGPVPCTLLLECPDDCHSPTGDLEEFLDSLAAWVCEGPEPLPGGYLQLYRSSEKLFSLPFSGGRVPTSEHLEPLYGEMVNGRFTAPDDGVLIVTVDGPSAMGDIWGSECPNDGGWAISPESDQRQGKKISPRKCLALDVGQRFDFNVRTGREVKGRSFAVTFDWYCWPYNCCLVHMKKVLEIEPLPLYTADRPLPQMRLFRPYGDSTAAIELRLPTCGTNARPGNFTDWFLAWPKDAQGFIREGFGKGWQIVGSSLKSPDGQIYRAVE